MLESFRHLFKLDPDKEISDAHLEKICTSATDGIMIGGSTGVTYFNTSELLNRILPYKIPCILEVSNLNSIVLGFDGYFIPIVLNSPHVDWIMGHHHQAILKYKNHMPWNRIFAEGYVVLHEDSAVAQVTGAHTDLNEAEVEAYAQMASRLFQLPIFYVEYSGKFGDMHLLASIRQSLTSSTRLFYGGGVNSYDKAYTAGLYADTVIVGNIVYEDISAAMQTIEAVKGDF